MRDHQLFEETVLGNGITVYTYTDTFPISCMEVQLPVGSGHAIAANGFLAGSPHFLEHTQLIRSQEYPEAYALDRALGRRAGNSNGATHANATTHWIDTPASETEFGARALVDRVFHPIFHEEDIEIERTVVINERNQNKFYPGKTKASQFYYREFINDVFYPLEQIFGSDADLAALDVARLQAMHQKITTSSAIRVLAVGNHSFDSLKESLASLPTQPRHFENNILPTTWTRAEYQVVYFDTIPQPRLEVTWIHPRLPYPEFRAVCFILTYLINSTQGPLYQEFREEKGWTYSLDASCMVREHNVIFGLTFPVNSSQQVDYIRECLAERIETALKNQSLIEDEITRQLGNQVYAYQTAGSIISSASNELITYGHIHSETEQKEALDALRDANWRTTIWKKYFQPEDMGSLCFMPERRQA